LGDFCGWGPYRPRSVYGCFAVLISMGQGVPCSEMLTKSELKHLALRQI
jgi:hypothetical protein